MSIQLPMQYQWDEGKRTENVAKHGVDFADAVAALEDPNNRTIADPDSQGETRWITLGMDALLRVLLVVWTERGESGGVLRIISARRASRGEARHYSGA